MDNHETPYGKLVSHIDLLLDNDEPYKLPYINPFALLYVLSNVCVGVGDMVHNALRGGFAKLILYFDEIKPGNILRPDQGRSLQCVYWTVLGFPDWFRIRDAGWFPITVMTSKRQSKLPGGASALFRKIMRAFFAPGGGWNLQVTGVRCKSSEGDFLARFTFGGVLADEKAQKEVWSLKGASGTKCCGWCKNVVGRMTVERGGYLVHYSWATPDEFDAHTDDSYRAMIATLTRTASQCPRQELFNLAQVFGINYDTNSILWDQDIMELTSPASGIYWDWMHNLVASGGVFQYEANAFLIAVKDTGISLSDVDEIAQTIIWPRKYPKLTHNFFATRVTTDTDGHIRAFAAEMFNVDVVLQVFIEYVLQPAGMLGEQCTCMGYMRTVLGILRLQDGALQYLPELRTALRNHHTLFLRLYPNLAKPKLHYMWHVCDCLERFAANMSC